MKKILIFILTTLMVPKSYLVEFKWVRKTIGGRWELWWVDTPINSEVWHHINEKDLKANSYYRLFGKPTSLCRGIPEIEDWS